jgi:hypothetical protein
MVIPFEKSFASHSKSKFWSKKNTIKPEEVYISSNKKRWFDCDKCTHSFEKKLHHILKNSWCPYCTNQKLIAKNVLKNHLLHMIKFYFGVKLQPKDVFKSTSKKFWFNCNNCNHDFEK